MLYKDFAVWVSKELNIDLTSYKESQVERRLKGLLLRRNIEGFEGLKKTILLDKKERERFIEFITINVTEFFRNPELFIEFKEIIREDLKKNPRKLKIWSAACSYGCEPYTISMILKEISPNYKHEIIATDIDNSILNKAKIGEYTSTDIKNVDDNYKGKYFIKDNDKYRIHESVKSLVNFKKQDLIKDTYETNFDVIVCRNVVIYFKNEVKDRIFLNFTKSLKPGGLLFIGATESIYNYREYGLEKVSTFIYRKK